MRLETKSKKGRDNVINWEAVRWFSYFGLFIGAPAVFFFILNCEKETDASRSATLFHDAVDEVASRKKEAFTAQMIKKDDLLKEKTELLKQKDVEIARMHSLLKYVRTTPENTDPPKEDPDFGDDTL
jgi:hypothetical protein